MVNLFGEYRYKVDAKGRLALPAKFRKELGDDLVVTIDPIDKQCLYVFRVEDFTPWLDSFFSKDEEFNNGDRKKVRLRSYLRGAAMPLQSDAQGRVALSAPQRETCGIEKDVVIIGNEGYCEIWDAKRREEFNDSFDMDELLGN